MLVVDCVTWKNSPVFGAFEWTTPVTVEPAAALLGTVTVHVHAFVFVDEHPGADVVVVVARVVEVVGAGALVDVAGAVAAVARAVAVEPTVETVAEARGAFAVVEGSAVARGAFAVVEVVPTAAAVGAG